MSHSDELTIIIAKRWCLSLWWAELRVSRMYACSVSFWVYCTVKVNSKQSCYSNQEHTVFEEDLFEGEALELLSDRLLMDKWNAEFVCLQPTLLKALTLNSIKGSKQLPMRECWDVRIIASRVKVRIITSSVLKFNIVLNRTSILIMRELILDGCVW